MAQRRQRRRPPGAHPRHQRAVSAGPPRRVRRTTALGYADLPPPGLLRRATYVLADLAADGLLPSQLRVLDVGAGVGGPAVALRDLLPDDALLDYHAVEPSAAADVLEHLLEDAARTSAGRFTGHSPRSSTRRRRLSATTAVVGPETGTAVATTHRRGIRPHPLRQRPQRTRRRGGDPLPVRRGARRRRDVAGAGPRRPEHGHTAPNCRARGGRRRPGDGVWADRATLASPSPNSESWSFDRKPDSRCQPRNSASTTLPAGQASSHTDVQFVFPPADRRRAVPMYTGPGHPRADGRRRELRHRPGERSGCETQPRPRRAGGRKSAVSAGRRESAGRPLRRAHRGVDAERGPPDADYGDLLSFENALVLWNDDEEAYNVVVDGETVIDRAR